MIRAGDELSQTKHGNNNSYCQDNELTWPNWNLDERKENFLRFVRYCAQTYREQPALQRQKSFMGRALRGSDIKDISFSDPAGHEMTDEAWNTGFARCLGVRLARDKINEVDERGGRIIGDTLLLLMNAHWEQLDFVLPVTAGGDIWQVIMDTAFGDRPDPEPTRQGRETFPLYGRSLVLMRTVRPEQAQSLMISTQLAMLGSV